VTGGQRVPTNHNKGEKRPHDTQAHEKQSDRFKKTARELGCDETPGALDRAFGKIDPSKRQGQKENVD
jgi:hypothetical protein